MLRAELLLERRDALDDEGLVGMGARLLGSAVRQDAGRNTLGGGGWLALYAHLSHQDVADRHDNRPAHGKQTRIEESQPRPDGQLRAPAHMR